MPSYASPAASRPGDVAGTLRLLAYLAIAIALIVADHRGDWLDRVRGYASVAMQPVWWLAGLPSRLGRNVREDAVTRALLADDNRRLRNELLVSRARLARLQVAATENARLRGLLGSAERGGLDVRLAPILDVDLDPTRQRVMLSAGARQGVTIGQCVIDAGGVVGQIIETTPTTATVLLLTDPDHAVPVVVARTGVRLVVYGQGRSDRLRVPNVPLSSDVEVGDELVTSGLGGRFPPGFPVGRIAALAPDDSRAFLVGDVVPAARLDRGRDVLLLQEGADPAIGNRGAGGPAGDAEADAGAEPAAGGALPEPPAAPEGRP
ncbi:rod shape-determining protein MreC [Luteimonas sp. SJ-92]|uniref:Cell shape-determining protein MreC n=1 Tax=Luteimonas salinisoli TaxID=2752307 RepID=A0A853JE86_9GAMM|nr:rod shape-determining protein MreC [Luteimonas salinisoli]NZA27165.1 rod shape-determining protein MreC [Luteimonas salinisoli]